LAFDILAAKAGSSGLHGLLCIVVCSSAPERCEVSFLNPSNEYLQPFVLFADLIGRPSGSGFLAEQIPAFMQR
jgi:hypothetical protein